MQIGSSHRGRILTVHAGKTPGEFSFGEPVRAVRLATPPLMRVAIRFVGGVALYASAAARMRDAAKEKQKPRRVSAEACKKPLGACERPTQQAPSILKRRHVFANQLARM